MKSLLLILAGIAMIHASSEAQQNAVSTSRDTRGVSLTIYNQNFAVVRETRTIPLSEGMNILRYEDVAAKIDPTSISFKSLTAPGEVSVREQNYQYDLLTPQAILEKSLGKRVSYKRVHYDGKTEIVRGTIIGTNSGTVLKTDEGQLVLNPWGEVMVEELPEGLVPRPSLLWKLQSGNAGVHTTEVSYITNEMTWKADYVAVVAEAEDKVDITGWVTLNNRSGATYKNAQLQLLAGDVRRVQEQKRRYDDRLVGAAMPMNAPAAPQFQEESFFEYHLYTHDGSTDVRDNETKQMTLMSAADVTVQRKLVFDGGRYWPYTGGYGGPGSGSSTSEKKANVMLELKNSKDNNMGMPLPKGKVRVYKADKRGNLQFLGEDLIDHTPKDETVKLYIGDAFDVLGERKQMEYNQISDRVREESYEISLRNHKNEDVTVYVTEHIFGDWKMLSNSHDFLKKDATTVEFPVVVPKNGETTVTYRVRITW